MKWLKWSWIAEIPALALALLWVGFQVAKYIVAAQTQAPVQPAQVAADLASLMIAFLVVAFFLQRARLDLIERTIRESVDGRRVVVFEGEKAVYEAAAALVRVTDPPPHQREILVTSLDPRRVY